MNLQPDTLKTLLSIPKGTVAAQSARIGWTNEEPLLVGLDGMLRYARAYRMRFDSQLADDSVLGDEWLSVVKGLRGLLNGDGAVAMELGRTTDSKDNGACEAIFWAAMNEAGFTEEAL